MRFVPMPTTKDLIAAKTDTYCQNMVKLVAIDPRFTVDDNELVCLKEPID